MTITNSDQISQSLESSSFNLDEDHSPNIKNSFSKDSAIFIIQSIRSYFGLPTSKIVNNRNNLESLLDANHFHYRVSTLNLTSLSFEQIPFIGINPEDNSLLFCNVSPQSINAINLKTRAKYSFPRSESSNYLADNVYEIFPTFPHNISTGLSLFKFFFPAIKKDAINIVLLSLFLNLLLISAPLITAQVVGNVVPSGNIPWIISTFFICILIAFSQASFAWIQSYYLLRVRQKLSYRLEIALYERILSFPISFVDSYNVGDLTSRATSVSVVLNSLSSSSLSSIVSTFSIFAFGGLMFIIDKELAFLALVLILISSIVQFYFLRKQLKYRKSLIELEADTYNDIIQSLGSIAQIRANACEPFVLSRLFAKYLTISFENLKVNRLSDYGSLLSSFTSGFGVFIIYAALLFRLFTSKTAPDFIVLTSTFIIFSSAFASFSASFSNLIEIINDLSGPVWIHWKRALPLLQQIPESGLDPSKPPIELIPNYKFNNVSFNYPTSTKIILDNVSFNLKANSFNVLFGPSGCGKSTILSLLLNFYQSDKGSIFVNNSDINDINIKSYRNQIGSVLQQSTLPVGSIRDALTYGLPFDEEKLWNVLSLVNLVDEISRLPMRLETILSEGASNISGGQRQRLCIARALLHNPKVLLEDEATSAIDSNSQRIIVDNLKSMKITRIVVAHRLTAIQGCDHMVVFNNGKVEAEGTYDKCIIASPYLSSIVSNS